MSYDSQRDEILGFLLIRFAANPDFDIRDSINTLKSTTSYTNTFYYDTVKDNNIGLIVPDTTLLRQEAAKYNLSDMIYFGHNTDPIAILSLENVRDGLMMRRNVGRMNILGM